MIPDYYDKDNIISWMVIAMERAFWSRAKEGKSRTFKSNCDPEVIFVEHRGQHYEKVRK